MSRREEAPALNAPTPSNTGPLLAPSITTVVGLERLIELLQPTDTRQITTIPKQTLVFMPAFRLFRDQGMSALDRWLIVSVQCSFIVPETSWNRIEEVRRFIKPRIRTGLTAIS